VQGSRARVPRSGAVSASAETQSPHASLLVNANDLRVCGCLNFRRAQASRGERDDRLAGSHPFAGLNRHTPFRTLPSPMVRPGPRTWLTDERREAVAECRRFGMVPLAIADYLGFSDATVARYVRELEAEGLIDRLPAWLTLHGPKRGRKCPTCGK
jgi:hypothetical protein